MAYFSLLILPYTPQATGTFSNTNSRADLTTSAIAPNRVERVRPGLSFRDQNDSYWQLINLHWHGGITIMRVLILPS